jgi:hypothetical protein
VGWGNGKGKKMGEKKRTNEFQLSFLTRRKNIHSRHKKSTSDSATGFRHRQIKFVSIKFDRFREKKKSLKTNKQLLKEAQAPERTNPGLTRFSNGAIYSPTEWEPSVPFFITVYRKTFRRIMKSVRGKKNACKKTGRVKIPTVTGANTGYSVLQIERKKTRKNMVRKWI